MQYDSYLWFEAFLRVEGGTDGDDAGCDDEDEDEEEDKPRLPVRPWIQLRGTCKR